MAETVWNVTIPDTSPLVQFAPFSDTSAGAGWEASYTGGSEREMGTLGAVLGIGDSRHVTELDGAEATIVFHGSAIHLEGSVDNGMSYEVVLDGQTFSPVVSGRTLASFNSIGVTPNPHSITLRAKKGEPAVQGAQLVFERAVVTVGSGVTGARVSNATMDDVETASIQYSPGFIAVNDPHVESNTLTRATSSGEWAALDFSGNAIFVHGITNQNHRSYRVDLDGTSFDYNATSRHYVSDALLFYQGGLDPSTIHSLKITNLDPAPFEVDFIRVLSATGGTPISAAPDQSSPTADPKSSNDPSSPVTAGNSPASRDPTPAIIGASVGGCLALIGLFIVIFFLLRRRYRPRDSLSVDFVPPPPPTNRISHASVKPVTIRPLSPPMRDVESQLTSQQSRDSMTSGTRLLSHSGSFSSSSGSTAQLSPFPGAPRQKWESPSIPDRIDEVREKEIHEDIPPQPFSPKTVTKHAELLSSLGLSDSPPPPSPPLSQHPISLPHHPYGRARATQFSSPVPRRVDSPLHETPERYLR